MKIKELMTTGVCSVKPEAAISEVARQMRKIDVGIMPVCNDKEELLGIVTDRDIVIRFLASPALAENNYDIELLKSPVSQIMSEHVISAPQDMNIHDAALLLSHHKIRFYTKCVGV